MAYRTLSGAPPDSPVRQIREPFGMPLALYFEPNIGLFNWLVVNLWHLYNLLSGTIIRGTLKTPNSQLVTPISIKAAKA
jgi:hypothetical protein